MVIMKLILITKWLHSGAKFTARYYKTVTERSNIEKLEQNVTTIYNLMQESGNTVEQNLQNGNTVTQVMEQNGLSGGKVTTRYNKTVTQQGNSYNKIEQNGRKIYDLMLQGGNTVEQNLQTGNTVTQFKLWNKMVTQWGKIYNKI